MNEFINKLIDDIHNINPELALKRQTEYNQNFVNSALNQRQTLPVDSVSKSACVGCGEDVEDFSEDNNCCTKCWLSI